MQGLFLILIKISTGAVSAREALSMAPSESEWKDALITAAKHTLTGVLLPAVQEINAIWPVPFKIWMQWNYFTTKIKEQNAKLDRKITELSDILSDAGFYSCILKGQGVAQYYPEPGLRAPGDIDVWIVGKEDMDKPLSVRREKAVAYLRGLFPNEEVVYHHMDMPVFVKTGAAPDQQVLVEAHFTPSYLLGFRVNRKLQSYFQDSIHKEFTNMVKVPEGTEIHASSLDFNRVFLLIHIYKHLFDEGIGLRQLMDYFYVLKAEAMTESEKQNLSELLKSFRMQTFIKAVMYVMVKVFGLDEAHMICEADEKEGSFLLEEVLKAGNFGKFDNRQDKGQSRKERFIRKTRRNLRFLRSYPGEVLSDLPFRVWQFLWRARNGWFQKR